VRGQEPPRVKIPDETLAPLESKSAAKQDTRAARLRVLLPEEEARLLIHEHATKQKGASRLFVSPPLAGCGTYMYELKATWEPNNYTKVTRTKKVVVQAGRETTVDLRQADPRNPDHFLIRFVPTPDEVIEAMCKLGEVGKDDVVFDLGCGDGRIVVAAVKAYGAKRGVGVDIDPERIKESNLRAKKEKVADRVEFRQADVLNLRDLGEASVVMLYMGEDVNLRLLPILKKTLRPGSRVVSHDFPMGDWKPEKKVQVHDEFGEEHDVYLWRIGR
jgi:uncharacterized protein (TIGR03000 family)